jgi:cyanophycinase-like exopeptidase
MQTKFVLYGGFNPEEANPGNFEFSQELLKEAPENAKVLVVPFAKEVDRIIPTHERVSAELNAAKWQKNIFIEGATEENLIQQINSADVIYFQGGSSSKLLNTLKRFPYLKQYLEGKTIGGDSGGGNVLCKFFYSPKTDTINEGLGILPLKIIPHFKEEYRNKLDSVSPDLHTVLLPEYSYKVIMIE